MNPRQKLLIVDDEPDMVSLLKRTLAPELDCEILTAYSAREALGAIKSGVVDLILLDIKMPEMNGMKLLSKIKENEESPTVVMMTAYGVIEMAVESIRKGAYDFITKPFDETRLILTLKKALEYNLLVHENQRLHERIRGEGAFNSIIGNSPKMKRVFEMIQRVSRSDATVLLTGESGTGKELVARAIHENSPRSKRPFVIVNCPTIPENILETELFGYVKGAFTDARADKKGLFQEAEGGTISLDEIGELPNNLQTKLLRVLQNREIKPIGQNKSFKVDVRVVASTNRNLKEQMHAGRFREDLYYRLNVVAIELPPLRERAEDIPLLVKHFMKKGSRELGKKELEVPPEVMDALMNNPWNGNVRELENSIERAIIMGKGPGMKLSDVGLSADSECLLSSQDMHRFPYKKAKEHVLTNFNHEYLSQLLTQHQGNVTRAATACGLERQALQQIIRRYGINAEDFRQADQDGSSFL
ncbi:MAG: sigma-54 dependent transcriptional regulator [Pseudomonadota bacterium]